MFFDFFTRRPLFEGQAFNVINKIQKEQTTPPSEFIDVQAKLNEILLTALEKRKQDRYETIIYFRDEIQ